MPALLDREKISPSMQKALCNHILREREKRKQEAAEAEKDFERKAKEEEEKRKKLEEEHSTLEEIKDQLVKLREKQETLRQEKHQLFCQLKKVLHEEGKRKARLREQSEQGAPSGMQFQQHGMLMNPHHILPQNPRYQAHQQAAYLSAASNPILVQQLQQGLKRSHSPTPPASNVIQVYQRPATTVHAPSQHKYESSYAGRSSYMSPAHGSSHHAGSPSSIHLASGRVHTQFQQNHGSTPGRPGSGQFSYSSTIAKPQDQGVLGDDRVRSRITMIPQNPANLAFQSSLHMRSSSPGRFNTKSEKDQVTFQTNANASQAHSRHSASQNASRIMYQKHN
ncbi:uncharacterized protein LOC143448442 [Clavelina lepadiformis]|uniref:G protein pathway suppressor 2 n=1 Tax=Clavelina lepadiformis TaxID=159417 RepID=A0ABP0H677_CLALP